MFQLESYKPERYIKWIKNNKIISLKELLLIIPIVAIFFSRIIGLIINIIFILLLWIIRKKHTEKKPLVNTNRIKRMYSIELLIFLIIAIFANYGIISMIVLLNLYIIFSYFMVVIVSVINSPIERKIQSKFYNMAKRKLQDSSKLQVIGITGSYGKTSTKYILGTILEQKFNVLITPESYNTTMGVVRTINERLNNTHEIFVCEMGAKNIGDIKEICDLVKPKYGVLTAIGPQHLETFKTLENVKRTKLELVDSLPEDGMAFINYEDKNIKSANIIKNNIKFGLTNQSDYYADNIKINEYGSNFDIHTKNGEIIPAKTKLLGMHNILNIVGAVSVAKEIGLNVEEIKTGIKFLKSVTHRLELKRNPNGSIIIDDAYNSNPQGARMALEVLKSFKNRKRILITPGIIDLGDSQEEYNKEFGRQAANAADYIILVGERQAKDIRSGIEEYEYDSNNVYVAKDLRRCIS